MAMRGVGKAYPGADRPGEREVRVLRDVEFQVCPGEHLAITGPSGSGKSTLMHLLGLLDQPSTGEYTFSGEDVRSLDNAQLSLLRNRQIGFVFQTFYLLPKLTVLENVLMPLRLRGQRGTRARDTAHHYLDRVGLGRWATQRPAQLSGGQKQRVVVARALAQEPAVILADEPTGNLDRQSGLDVLQLFDELHDQGRTVIVVTHDPAVAVRAARMIRIEDGLIVSDERRG